MNKNEHYKRLCEEAVIKAVEIAGGQSALARACGGSVKQQHVFNWLHRNKKIPVHEVGTVVHALNGAMNSHELRPDIFPLENTQTKNKLRINHVKKT